MNSSTMFNNPRKRIAVGAQFQATIPCRQSKIVQKRLKTLRFRDKPVPTEHFRRIHAYNSSKGNKVKYDDQVRESRFRIEEIRAAEALELLKEENCRRSGRNRSRHRINYEFDSFLFLYSPKTKT